MAAGAAAAELAVAAAVAAAAAAAATAAASASVAMEQAAGRGGTGDTEQQVLATRERSAGESRRVLMGERASGCDTFGGVGCGCSPRIVSATSNRGSLSSCKSLLYVDGVPFTLVINPNVAPRTRPLFPAPPYKKNL